MNANELMTVVEFAHSLRVKTSCVRRWILERKVTTVHVGRLVRIPANEVLRIISAGTRPAMASKRATVSDGKEHQRD